MHGFSNIDPSVFNFHIQFPYHDLFLCYYLQVGLDSQTACYEIDYSEVDMDDAILIGEVITGYPNF
jgi:hypothetical protein